MGATTGREIKIGLKKGAAWHTPVVCGAGDGLLITTDGLKATIGMELDDSAGQPWVEQADSGPMQVSGSLEGYLRYEGFDVALALICGIAGVPTQVDATTAYTNSYKLATNIDGLFATIAMLKLTDKVWEYPSAKLHGFKLTGEMNKPVKLTLDVIADLLDRASTTNTDATMAGVTEPDSENRVIMNKNTIFRINDRDDVALSGTDQINPSKFDFTFNRPMSAEPVAGVDGVDEPADDGFPVASLNLSFPRYTNAGDAFLNDWTSFTSKKMDILFTGKLIESGNNYEFRLSFPHLKVENPEAAISGPGKIPLSLKLSVLGSKTAPLGMTGITQPFQLDVQNKRTTDPLG